MGAKSLSGVPSRSLFPCTYRANTCLQFIDLQCHRKMKTRHQALVILSPSLSPPTHASGIIITILDTGKLLRLWMPLCSRRAELVIYQTRFVNRLWNITWKEQKSDTKVHTNVTFSPSLHPPSLNLCAVKHIMHFFR